MDLSKLPGFARPAPGPPTGPAPEAAPGAAVEAAPGAVGAPAETRLAHCPQCGTKVPPGYRFCGSCGASVMVSPEAGNPLAPPAQPAGAPPAAGRRDTGRERERDADPAAGLFGGAEVWFFAIIGLLLVLWGGPFAHYQWARWTGQKYYPYPSLAWQANNDKGHAEGDAVDFRELQPPYQASFQQDVWTNSSIFVPGLALLVAALARGVALLRIRRLSTPLLGFALVMLALATVYDLSITVQFFQAGITPQITMLFVAVCGFLFFEQLISFQSSRRGRGGARA